MKGAFFWGAIAWLRRRADIRFVNPILVRSFFSNSFSTYEPGIFVAVGVGMALSRGEARQSSRSGSSWQVGEEVAPHFVRMSLGDAN